MPSDQQNEKQNRPVWVVVLVVALFVLTVMMITNIVILMLMLSLIGDAKQDLKTSEDQLRSEIQLVNAHVQANLDQSDKTNQQALDAVRRELDALRDDVGLHDVKIGKLEREVDKNDR